MVKPWAWSVTLDSGEVQFGQVETFKDALAALAAWQGDEDDVPHLVYLITHIPFAEDSSGR